MTVATSRVKSLIITGFGLNCEAETTHALQTAGSDARQIHLNDIIAGDESLADVHLLVFIGGFSFGDHIGAGTVFANRLRCRLRPQLEAFVAEGKLVLGICNGFQTIARLGLVPAAGKHYFTEQATLAQNTQGVFRDAWTLLRANPDSPCVFTPGINRLPLPIRHGEGRFVARDAQTLAHIEENDLVVFRYAHPQTGEATDEFPHNPNGSAHAIAGVCDPTGRIFGLMPHPEAYLSPYNHPQWTRQKLNGVLPEKGLGQLIFDNGVAFARQHLV